MGALSPQANLCFLFLAIIIMMLEYNEVAARTGRTYGTWVDRRRERDCKRNLVCAYRAADCMNLTPEKQWHCTANKNSMIAKKCVIKLCDKNKGMVCLSAPPPGDNMTEVDSNSCALSERCYTPNTTDDTTDDTTAAPSTTAASSLPGNVTTAPAGATANTTEGSTSATTLSGTNVTTSSTNVTVTAAASVTTNVAVTDETTTLAVADKNATDTIWTSDGLSNSTSSSPSTG